MIALVAITDTAGPALPEGLRAAPAGDLAAICTEVDSTALSPEALWRHDALVESLMEERDVLPVRYGTRLPDAAHAVQAVAERHDALAAALDRVRDAVEVALRIAATTDAAEPEAAARSAYARLAAHAREAVLLTPHDTLDILRAAYLVDRASVSAFSALVAAMQDDHPDLRLLATGPWAPYSFADR